MSILKPFAIASSIIGGTIVLTSLVKAGFDAFGKTDEKNPCGKDFEHSAVAKFTQVVYDAPSKAALWCKQQYKEYKEKQKEEKANA